MRERKRDIGCEIWMADDKVFGISTTDAPTRSLSSNYRPTLLPKIKIKKNGLQGGLINRSIK